MFCWRFSIYSLSLFIRYILINQCGCAAFQKGWNDSDLWTGAAAWGARGRLDPEGGRLGPARVRRGPTPGSGGPMQQVGDIGLPPNRHPPEVVAALAAHGAGLAPRSALSPALVRTRVSARRAPKGQPDAGGCRLHAPRLARLKSGDSGLRRAAPLCSGGSWASLPRPFLPGARRATQFGARALRLPHSPDAATAATGLGLLPRPSLRSQTPEALWEGRG